MLMTGTGNCCFAVDGGTTKDSPDGNSACNTPKHHHLVRGSGSELESNSNCKLQALQLQTYTHTMHASSPMCMRTLLCVIGSESETNWKHIGNILETY